MVATDQRRAQGGGTNNLAARMEAGIIRAARLAEQNRAN